MKWVMLILFLFPVLLCSQSKDMTVHLKSGIRYTVPISEISKLTFSDVERSVNDYGLLKKPGIEQIFGSPNPFFSNIHINCKISVSGFVSILIFNSRGKQIRKIEQGFQNEGSFSAMWDGTDENGIVQTDGLFFLQINLNGTKETSKIIKLK